jgi:hypothetical protein
MTDLDHSTDMSDELTGGDRGPESPAGAPPGGMTPRRRL